MEHRVQKLLSNYGYCSRRKAEELIEQGRVTVNGRKISLGDKAGLKDTIAVNGEVVAKSEKVYLLFHKPLKCVTALTDAKLKTVMDYIKVSTRVFPIGRLDYNTTGVLLFTNDGDFANKIMHPRYEIKKTYYVKTAQTITKNAVYALKHGVKLEDFTTRPAKVKIITPQTVEVTIHEGKNRIVRRMFEALGIEVIRLTRIRVGKLGLGNLKPGQYRELTSKDKKAIFGK